MRVRAREAALQVLFSLLFDNPASEEDKEIIFKSMQLDEKGKSFANRLYSQARDNQASYLEEIAAFSKGYSIDRMFALDKCALILAVAEISTEDVPIEATINEWVSIVKRYSTENSVSFVNGILAAYKIKRENK